MKTEIEETVTSTYIETLENIAFIFSDKIDQGRAEDKLEQEENFYSSSMKYSGAYQGNLKLITEKSLCRIIADNMLGGIEDESEEILLDGLKELTNVICGKLITEIAGEEPIVDLSIPDINSVANESIVEAIQSEDSLSFDSDGHLVVIQFDIQKD